MRRRDWADDESERLYDLARDGADDEKVVEAIADALRKAAGTEKPPHLSRRDYDAARKGQS